MESEIFSLICRQVALNVTDQSDRASGCGLFSMPSPSLAETAARHDVTQTGNARRDEYRKSSHAATGDSKLSI
jgi:hypothetical protein